MKNNEKNDRSFLTAGIIQIPLTVFPVMLYYIGIITRYSPDHILSHFEQKQIKNIFSAGGIFMFREMRRKRQSLTLQECTAVLQKGTSGVLALSGDNDYPYAVPISYLYEDGRLYFHCARSGHKLDAIRRNPKASFCVIDQDQVVPREYTTYFRSVIAFGTIHILEKDEEKRAAIEKLALRYAPDDSAYSRSQIIEKEWTPLCMLEMTIEHLTGKEAIELVRKKQSTETEKSSI